MPAKRTKVSSRYVTCIYTNKHARLDLIDRIRVLAIRRGNQTIEQTCNEVWAAGLPILEELEGGNK